MIDLNELSKQTLENAEKRALNVAHINTDTRSMLKHLATEVVEAVEANHIKTMEGQKHFASELADVICCCLIIAGKEKLDIERAVLDCIEKNRKRAEGTGDKL